MWTMGLLFCVIVLFVLLRTVYLMVQLHFGLRKSKRRRFTAKVRTLVVIGSGGHTTEMLTLVKALDHNRYEPRSYIMSQTDKLSEQKIHNSEIGRTVDSCSYDIMKIPRSREVHQSYFSSIFSTLWSTVHCVAAFWKARPDIVICNGPGTCVPICFVAFLMRLFFLSDNRILFIESICRVHTLSLTGKILLTIADQILVQWPELDKFYLRTKYIGRL